MPGPIIGTQGFDGPPEELKLISVLTYEYLNMIHNTLFVGRDGQLGLLDSTNIVGDLTNTVDHNQFTGVDAYQHHGSDAHGELTQAARTNGAIFPEVIVLNPDAGATYTVAEQALVNEIKADIATLNTNIQSIGTAINRLLTAMQTAGLQA
jgi:hypothetical protein